MPRTTRDEATIRSRPISRAALLRLARAHPRHARILHRIAAEQPAEAAPVLFQFRYACDARRGDCIRGGSVAQASELLVLISRHAA